MRIDSKTNVKEFESTAKFYVNSENFLKDFSCVYPESPWSEDSLNALEANILSRFSSYDEVPEGLEESLVAFLGEGLIKVTSGKWVILEPEVLGFQSEEYGLCIENPDGSMHVANSLLPNAMRFRTGKYWSSLFTAENS